MISLLLVAGCGTAPVEEPAPAPVTTASVLRDNPAPWIPPACYANTTSRLADDAPARNPCAACHQRPRRPNFVDDEANQLVFTMPGAARTNHWTNLFADRSAAVAAISDEAIDAWVGTDNYRDGDRLLLAERLAATDVDGDGAWSGFVPDAWFDFDERGFDRDPSGRPTGWRGYLYRPFPGFFPTNGSWGDALIRLAAPWRQAADGAEDLDVYAVNLAIVDAMIQRADVPLEAPVDEVALEVDLDRDGTLGTADHVAYAWAPLKGQNMSWVGAARTAEVPPPTEGLLPGGTELLHSVRYVAVDGEAVAMAPRMKELRYARKDRHRTYSELGQKAADEQKERKDFPDRLKTLRGDMERGLRNGLGWTLQGFIEDADGALRPQTFEETGYCVGCHGGVGANTDSGFSFARRAGWGHPQSAPYAAGPDRLRGDGRGEIEAYVQDAGGTGDWAVNPETAGLVADDEAREGLRADVSAAVLPSPGRARSLNKAYKVIVDEQGFTRGRDAVWGLTDEHAHREVADDLATGVVALVPAPWQR